MGKNSIPSYNDRERYLMEHESTGIKDKRKDFMKNVGMGKISSRCRESSRITAQEIFSTVRDLFVDNSSCVVDRYKIIAFKESVELSPEIIDNFLTPIVKAIADLKREISSRPAERELVRRKDAKLVRFYDMVKGDTKYKSKGKKKKIKKNKNKGKSI